jgi:hypothetical protein
MMHGGIGVVANMDVVRARTMMHGGIGVVASVGVRS